MVTRIGSLFSGAGGLDMAVEVAFGGHTVWHCELDEAASLVLAHRWPGVPNLGDITIVDWSTVEAIEILCGGFPCQDVSPAGRRAGLKDGTRSGLWAMFAEAIAALRPKVVVIENVRGLLSADGEEWPAEVVAADTEWARLARVVALIDSKIKRAIRQGWWHGEYKQRKQFESTRMARLRDRALARFRTLKRRLVQRAIGTVVADLAHLGYDAQWTTVSAASVGAPHKRERVFVLAIDANAPGQPWCLNDRDQLRVREFRGSPAELAPVGSLLPTPTAGDGQGGGKRVGITWEDTTKSTGEGGASRLRDVVALLPTPSVADSEGGHLTRSGARSDELLLPGVARAYGNGDLLPTPCSRDGKGTNPNRDGGLDLPGALLPPPAAADGERGPDFARAGREGSGGDDLVTLCARATRDTQWGKYAAAIERWEAVTRPAPPPTEPNTRGNPRLAPVFPEWMMGWPAGWVTALVVLGLISRNDALRIIGNGVCPQQAIAALRWLLNVCEVAA